ncbi:hypothetical protein [Pseudobacteriovorax antillogorgiicola]|uniref:Nitrite and sulphite reductase 4Fe-4S domain-containing protein n=1 Tax=Pseudobacteriovorax antillogorgiicola TaxID=1513793 RepID=A0A1Y6B7N1_9BACT|nr:hypothetical protein [Pseudobacteriovorax antillogorgiicola]TCS58589.1 nitrite/sulfite reductase ferredoxin-like protein [Pseudobacteriovorax antillogorgiicola]SME97157.1 Nitrite and sulphite reductase 4Fe-4S domain-containing protein [Pseudobacteriovorax antillogorgiicola]
MSEKLFKLKNGTLFLSTEAPGGIYNSVQLKKVAELCANDLAIVKATEDQRLGLFVKEEEAARVAKELEACGLGVRHYQQGLHQAVTCLGELCSDHEQDALGTAMDLAKTLAELSLESPLKIGINGCFKCCTPCHTLDIAVVGEANGYRISLGGKNQQVPELASFVAEGVPADKLPDLIKNVVTLYADKVEDDESLLEVIDRCGISDFVEALAPYSQDAAVQHDPFAGGDAEPDLTDDRGAPESDQGQDSLEQSEVSDDDLDLDDDLDIEDAGEVGGSQVEAEVGDDELDELGELDDSDLMVEDNESALGDDSELSESGDTISDEAEGLELDDEIDLDEQSTANNEEDALSAGEGMEVDAEIDQADADLVADDIDLDGDLDEVDLGDDLSLDDVGDSSEIEPEKAADEAVDDDDLALEDDLDLDDDAAASDQAGAQESQADDSEMELLSESDHEIDDDVSLGENVVDDDIDLDIDLDDGDLSEDEPSLDDDLELDLDDTSVEVVEDQLAQDDIPIEDGEVDLEAIDEGADSIDSDGDEPEIEDLSADDVFGETPAQAAPAASSSAASPEADTEFEEIDDLSDTDEEDFENRLIADIDEEAQVLASTPSDVNADDRESALGMLESHPEVDQESSQESATDDLVADDLEDLSLEEEDFAEDNLDDDTEELLAENDIEEAEAGLDDLNEDDLDDLDLDDLDEGELSPIEDDAESDDDLANMAEETISITPMASSPRKPIKTSEVFKFSGMDVIDTMLHLSFDSGAFVDFDLSSLAPNVEKSFSLGGQTFVLIKNADGIILEVEGVRLFYPTEALPQAS